MSSSNFEAPSSFDTTFVNVSPATELVNPHLSTHPCSKFSTDGTAEEIGKDVREREKRNTELILIEKF